MTRQRGFERIAQFSDEAHKDLNPKRETTHAAGYDLKVAEPTTIDPGEVLFLFDRSSNPRKKGLVLINSVGVIDSDYYNNPSNEGHIFAQMKNITSEAITLPYGERIVQGVFMNHLTVDNDSASGDRTGGFGSTDKN